MNADALIKHYERIADAPDAVGRLRRFVLDLAVRGKLVPQIADETRHPELIDRLKNIGHAQADLRNGWLSSSVGTLLDFQYGSALKASDRLSDGPVPVYGSNGVVGFTDTALTEKPSIIIGRKGSAGALNLANGPSWTTDVAYFVEPPPFLDLRFLFNLLASLSLDKLGKGVKPGLSRADAYAQSVSIPPLAEQHRIVAKVDELMALCDQLELARAEREATRDRLAAASLARLNTPDPDPKTFKAHASFAINTALPAITTRRDQVRQLRRTVLELAVRGKLVRQQASDEPSRITLRNIESERAQLVRDKTIRNEELPPSAREEGLPFELPSGWLWAPVGHVFLFTQYGTSQKSHPSSEGIPVLAMGNIQDGAVTLHDEKRIPVESEDLPALFLKKFDLLYNRTNSAELVGKTGIYLGADDALTFASYLIRLRPSLRSSNPIYLNLAMNAPFFRSTQIAPLIKKQTGQANVNGSALKNMLIPLPPLAEQHRIVTKVNELMQLCDQLEASLESGAVARRRLLDALLHEALAPAKEIEEAA